MQLRGWKKCCDAGMVTREYSPHRNFGPSLLGAGKPGGVSGHVGHGCGRWEGLWRSLQVRGTVLAATMARVLWFAGFLSG